MSQVDLMDRLTSLTTTLGDATVEDRVRRILIEQQQKRPWYYQQWVQIVLMLGSAVLAIVAILLNNNLQSDVNSVQNQFDSFQLLQGQLQGQYDFLSGEVSSLHLDQISADVVTVLQEFSSIQSQMTSFLSTVFSYNQTVLSAGNVSERLSSLDMRLPTLQTSLDTVLVNMSHLLNFYSVSGWTVYTATPFDDGSMHPSYDTLPTGTGVQLLYKRIGDSCCLRGVIQIAVITYGVGGTTIQISLPSECPPIAMSPPQRVGFITASHSPQPLEQFDGTFIADASVSTTHLVALVDGPRDLTPNMVGQNYGAVASVDGCFFVQ